MEFLILFQFFVSVSQEVFYKIRFWILGHCYLSQLLIILGTNAQVVSLLLPRVYAYVWGWVVMISGKVEDGCQ